MQHRRRFLTLSGGFCLYAAMGELRANHVPAGSVSLKQWLRQHEELARALAGGTVSPVEWHGQVNAMATAVDMEGMAFELRRARLGKAGDPFGHDPVKRFVTFLDETGMPIRVGYTLAIFEFGAKSVITPHAHDNMASAHMVIEGSVRVRTFDRIKDEDDAMMIMPTSDVVAEAGHAAAMTTEKDNVHWFAARSPRAMTLDVIITGLDSPQQAYVIRPVDPLGGMVAADGSIRAPLISVDQSVALYPANK